MEFSPAQLVGMLPVDVMVTKGYLGMCDVMCAELIQRCFFESTLIRCRFETLRLNRIL